MIIDIVHKGTEEKAGCCRVLCSSLFVDSWLQGKNVVGIVHKQQGWQQPWENREKSWFKNLGELLEEWTDAVLLGCCTDVQNAFFFKWSKGPDVWGKSGKGTKSKMFWSPVRSPHTVMTQGAKSSADVVGVLVHCFLSSPKSILTSTRRFYNTLCFHLQKSTTCSQCQNCYHDHVITVND